MRFQKRNAASRVDQSVAFRLSRVQFHLDYCLELSLLSVFESNPSIPRYKNVNYIFPPTSLDFKMIVLYLCQKKSELF